ncbi:MAG: SpoVR family protein [Candidatus Taylorbacteria bacterium]|nr:SpoVR family protein [Candidatus Taylorbacteria bacterium]
MTKKELERLAEIEKRVEEYFKEWGLLTTEITFEVTTSQRVLEGMSYMFPTNFSHWTFGRDYERHRTIYEHTGGGIPYEQIWNFNKPRAFLVETNPFALNATIIGHCFGHVDYFLGSRYLQHGRSFSNISEEAHNASERFAKYEEKYGSEVERVEDAGMSIMWHRHPDPFFEEQDEEVIRERLLELERGKLELVNDISSKFKKPETKEQIAAIEKKLEELSTRTPPEPTYDLLNYIIKHSPRPLKPWMVDVLTVLRNQARCLDPNMRTKMLDEGWAVYWHARVMRRLADEGLITPEEHGIYNYYHSKVTEKRKKSFNWYSIGWQIFENIKERWDKGQFGSEYDQEENPYKKASWDANAQMGDQKVKQVRSFYTDRMAVEEFFTDQFIRDQELYIYVTLDDGNGNQIDVIAEDDPKVIRQILKSMLTLYGKTLITIENGDYQKKGFLSLKHIDTGFELDPKYRDGTLEKIHYLWGKKVYLACKEEEKDKLFSFDFENRKKGQANVH